MAGRPKSDPSEIRSKVILMRCTPTEYEQIKYSANVTAHSVSSFCRKLALGYQPKPRIDVEHLREVMRARGDLGRAGGLLKLWLTEKEGQACSTREVRQILLNLENAADEVKRTVRRL